MEGSAGRAGRAEARGGEQRVARRGAQFRAIDFDVLNEHFGARRRPEESARATVASSESMFLAVEPVL